MTGLDDEGDPVEGWSHGPHGDETGIAGLPTGRWPTPVHGRAAGFLSRQPQQPDHTFADTRELTRQPATGGTAQAAGHASAPDLTRTGFLRALDQAETLDDRQGFVHLAQVRQLAKSTSEPCGNSRKAPLGGTAH